MRRLFEGDNPARAHMPHRRAEGGSRVGIVHEHAAPDCGIEVVVQYDRADRARDERDVRQTGRLRAIAGGLEDLRILLDADHRAPRANEVRDEERDIARTAADIEHLHPGTDARAGEEVPSGRIEQRTLPLEALGLRLRVTEGIGGRVCHLHAPSCALV